MTDCQRTIGRQRSAGRTEQQRSGRRSVLLAGGPGAGKSTVSQALRDRGLHSIDLDYGYARYEDLRGRPVRLPAEPTMHWLNTHRWQWQIDKIDQAIAESRGELIVFAGTAYNMFAYLDRFDLLLLLKIDDQTREIRLADPRRSNIFGKVGDTAAWSAIWHKRVETEIRTYDPRCIDGQASIESVTDQVIALSTSMLNPPPTR